MPFPSPRYFAAGDAGPGPAPADLLWAGQQARTTLRHRITARTLVRVSLEMLVMQALTFLSSKMNSPKRELRRKSPVTGRQPGPRGHLHA